MTKHGDDKKTKKAQQQKEAPKDKRTIEKKPVSAPARQNFGHMVIPLLAEKAPMPNRFTREEQRYLDSLPENGRKHLISQVEELTASSTTVPQRFRVMNSNLPNKREIFARLHACGENAKYEAWVEAALSLPIGKLAPPPLRNPSNNQIETYLAGARTIMDNELYGQHSAKNEVLRLICQWLSGGRLDSFAIALEGPAGIGKTTFAERALARAMERPFCFISLGGISDACTLLGHSFTYEGAICGRIAECLKKSKVMNPILYFDELDKVSNTPKGDEIINVLIHLTDREQNQHFQDRYFHGLELDLSDVLCCFSYNDSRFVNPILMDRLNVVKFDTPTIGDKVHIAREHLIPKICKRMGIQMDDIQIDESIVRRIVRDYTDENGVRNLDKALTKIMSTLNVACRTEKNLMTDVDVESAAFPFVCSGNVVDAIMGARKSAAASMMYS